MFFIACCAILTTCQAQQSESVLKVCDDLLNSINCDIEMFYWLIRCISVSNA